MKERPVIFSGEMVKVILDGRKTQTRRVIKNASGAFWDHAGYYPKALNENPEIFSFFIKSNNNLASYAPMFRCPYGQPGDRLWVRETWFIPLGGDPPDILFRADGISGIHDWRPSIFMPRWASRIILEITGVRIERVKDINAWDTMHEGLNPGMDIIYRFSKLWDSLNAKRGYGWETNCWVWVISFKRIKEGRKA